MITKDLLEKTIKAFPLLDEMARSTTLSEQDVQLANELNQAMMQCPEFHGMSAHLREVYFQHGMQIWVWLNIARCFMQVGYRLHSLEMAESFQSPEL